MDYYSLIATHFQDTIESIALSVDDFAGPLEASGQRMSNALLGDGKIIACGSGADGAVAQLFSAALLCGYHSERPALPAIALGCDATTAGAIAQTFGPEHTLARQVRALGQPGDILLCINSTAGTDDLLRAIESAQERNMIVVLLSNSNDQRLLSTLRADDIGLLVPALHQGRIIEIHCMVVHCLCELIEHAIFGDSN